MKRILPVVLSVLSCYGAIAQDAYEIQVYGSPTMAKKATIIELHSNYTPRATALNPNYHPLLETVEITTGLNDWFEFGVYLFNHFENGKYSFTGSNIRPRVMVPQSWKFPLGVSLSAELGIEIDPLTREINQGMEVRPIADKTWGKHYAAVNPNIEISLSNNQYQFTPNIKYGYSVSKKTSIGFEYYGNTGSVFNWEKPPSQQHQLYAAVDLTLHPSFEFNFGIGRGLTDVSNDWNIKLILGKRIHWADKNFYKRPN